ncbi:MAG: hypothetical protein H0X62_04935 [Bacteroidetes bacterium]|nr:hypothetical protein [Bacteroidota bacterium]
MGNIKKCHILFLIIIGCFYSMNCKAQESRLFIGPRLQKTLDLYHENGLSLQYANNKLISGRFLIGFNYISSRFGSAIGSNAIKQDNFFLSGSYHFLHEKKLQPFTSLNAGYFRADFESEIFSSLPNSSPLISLEGGLAVYPVIPLKISASVGYNVISGNGMKGPGTLFPFFYQLSLGWNILKI